MRCRESEVAALTLGIVTVRFHGNLPYRILSKRELRGLFFPDSLRGGIWTWSVWSAMTFATCSAVRKDAAGRFPFRPYGYSCVYAEDFKEFRKRSRAAARNWEGSLPTLFWNARKKLLRLA